MVQFPCCRHAWSHGKRITQIGPYTLVITTMTGIVIQDPVSCQTVLNQIISSSYKSKSEIEMLWYCVQNVYQIYNAYSHATINSITDTFWNGIVSTLKKHPIITYKVWGHFISLVILYKCALLFFNFLNWNIADL